MVILMSLTVGCAGEPAEKTNLAAKPALVLVAFGTSVADARKVFDHIDAQAKRRYPDTDIRWAFTSSFIRRKLAKQGIETKSPSQVVADLKAAGRKRAVFQSLHIAPGQEYRELHKIDTTGLTVTVGNALLTSDADIAAVVRALGKEIDPKAVNLVAAHGNDHYPKFNVQLVAFAKAMEKAYPDAFVLSVEGQPGDTRLPAAIARAKAKGRARFIPLMIVAGDHVKNDVFGEEADAWKMRVAAADNMLANPLGYNDAILAIYFQHIDEAIAANDAAASPASTEK